MAHFAIRVGHDMAGVGVDADQASDFDIKAGFFLDFTHRGFHNRFA
ncbi:hypothetical protein L839_3859 [Mycobacterium avium MAV_120809_2495]|nr:hypothetical protein L839_3859 [Mycobacterium avium MAV_120809_2495]